jgi:hypothetical protein
VQQFLDCAQLALEQHPLPFLCKLLKSIERAHGDILAAQIVGGLFLDEMGGKSCAADKPEHQGVFHLANDLGPYPQSVDYRVLFAELHKVEAAKHRSVLILHAAANP